MDASGLRGKVQRVQSLWRAHVAGPLLLLGGILLVEALSRTPAALPNPTPVLLLVVAYSALVDPPWKAGLTTFAAVAYAAVSFSDPLLSFDADGRTRFLVMAIAAPTMLLMTASLKRRAEALAREQEARASAEKERDFVRNALDAVPHAILVVNHETERVAFANVAAQGVLGQDRSSLVGRRLRALLGPSTPTLSALIGTAASTGSSESARDLPIALGEGREAVLDVGVAKLPGDAEHVVVSLVDATERHAAARSAEEARQHALQSEKMAALGTLVSGVAHELRSPLTVSQNHLELARREVERGETARAPMMTEHLGGVQDGLDRLGRVVEELRRFSRMEVGKRSREELGPCIEEALKLFEVIGRNKVSVQASLQPTPVVELDRTQIQQVVLNLLENAAAASASGGVVEVSVATEGSAGVIRVRDSGVGMPPQVRERVFDPFFTTKPDGTGLGLAIVRRIVEAHGGSIACESAVGQGSVFEVRLPPAGARLVPVSGPARDAHARGA